MRSAKNDMTFGLENNLTVVQQYNNIDYHTHLKKITKMKSTELLFAFCK